METASYAARVSESHRYASQELARRDPMLAELVARHGPMRIPRPPRASARFEALASTIVSQQLNGRAAASIWSRARALVDGPFTPQAALAVPETLWRSAGLSGAKAASVTDLAANVVDGRVRLDRIGRQSDEAVVDHLTAVRGIGPWTAQMFLIFGLGRLDVWPTGDYGVRNGFGRAFCGGTMPTPRDLEALGERFRPFRSVVAWYCWAVADDPTFTQSVTAVPSRGK